MDELIATLIEMTDDRQCVIIRRPLVRFTGSVNNALLLGQLLYWTPRSKKTGGWIAKTDQMWCDELYLKSHEIRTARKELEALGILSTDVRRFAGAPTVHYKLNLDILNEAWSDWVRKAQEPDLAQVEDGSCTGERSNGPVLAQVQNPSCTGARTCTETTPKTTQSSENTHTDTPAPAGGGDAQAVVWTADDNEALFGDAKAEPWHTSVHSQADVQALEIHYQPPPDWGAGSVTLERMMRRDPDNGWNAVQEVGAYLAEQGLEPVWSKGPEVKYWVTQIKELLELAHGDGELVIGAIEQAMLDNDGRAGKDKLTLTAPRSFKFAIRRALSGQDVPITQQDGSRFLTGKYADVYQT